MALTTKSDPPAIARTPTRRFVEGRSANHGVSPSTPKPTLAFVIANRIPYAHIAIPKTTLHIGAHHHGETRTPITMAMVTMSTRITLKKYPSAFRAVLPSLESKFLDLPIA